MAKWGEIKCPRCAELEAQITAMEEGLTAVHMAGYMDGKKAAEAKLEKATDVALRLYYGAGVVTEDMRATLAELRSDLPVDKTRESQKGGQQ